MRVSFHFPMEACSPEIAIDVAQQALACMLEEFVRMNVKLLGVLPPVEAWKHLELVDDDQENVMCAPALFSCGRGNILSLAALRAADLRRQGHCASARLTRKELPSGTIFLSCEVAVDGSLDEWLEGFRRPKSPEA